METTDTIALALIFVGALILGVITYKRNIKMGTFAIIVLAAWIFVIAGALLYVWILADRAMDKIAGQPKSYWVEKTSLDGKKYYFPKDGVKISKTVK